MSTPPLSEALSATSGTPRRSPTVELTGSWYAGRVKIADRPPAAAHGSAPKCLITSALRLSFQAVSGEIRRPDAVRCSVVPPTPVTSGSDAGQLTTGWV